MRILGILIISVLTFWACNKDSPKPNITYDDYYPISDKSYKIYQVDCLVYNDFTLKTDTYQFERKEYVESSYTDEGNRQVYRVERYKKDSTNKWVIQFVWLANKSTTWVEEQQQNIRLVNLSLPVRQNVRWDANARNNKEREEYLYQGPTFDTIIDGISHSKVQRVHHKFVTDPLQINTEIQYEHYTPKHGLINRYEKYVKRFTTGVPGDPIIDSGYEMSVRFKLQEFE